MATAHHAGQSFPPAPTRGMLGDLTAFLVNRPPIPTLIPFAPQDERENFSHQIMQRIGIDTTRYSVLNLHKIGVDAPARYVFEELLNWDGDSSCWPNHIATAERVNSRLEQIRIRPLGISRLPFNSKTGWEISPLFNLNALRIQSVPGNSDIDNARYMLFSCSGGYPIGIFVLYVRSSITDEGEAEQTQVFLGVGFNFYGREQWSLFHPVNRIWERIHNRVTANVLNRFKQLCEWRFEQTQAAL